MSDWIVKAPLDIGFPPMPVSFTPDYSDAPKCEHPTIEIRSDRHPKIGERFRKQCTVCGTGFGMVAKSSIKSFLGMKPFDKELEQAWRDKVYQYWKRKRESHEINIAQGRQQWNSWYQEYLKTPRWRAIRIKVLERDGYRCQGCLVAAAVEVHHRNYDHVGNELLFDLVSVCRECHERFHGH